MLQYEIYIRWKFPHLQSKSEITLYTVILDFPAPCAYSNDPAKTIIVRNVSFHDPVINPFLMLIHGDPSSQAGLGERSQAEKRWCYVLLC